MKRICLILLCMAFALSGAALFAACNKDGPSDIEPFRDGVGYNDNIGYKIWITSDEECPNGNIDESKLHAETVIESGKTYYVVVDFTVFDFTAAGWNSRFSASFTMADNLSLGLDSASTSDFDELPENGVPHVRVSYSIPRNRSASRGYRVVLQLVLNEQSDWLDFGVAFYGDGEYDVSDYENYRFLRYAHRVITCRQSEEVENFAAGNTEEVGLYYEKEITYGETEDDITEEYSVTICVGNTNSVESGSSVSVIVPLFHEGLPVTKVKGIVGQNDYYGSNYKCHIILSDNIREICEEFYDTNNSGSYGGRLCVHELVLPASLEIIPMRTNISWSLIDLHILDAAAWCNLTINDSYNNGDSSLNLVFRACTYLGKREMEELVVPDGVKELPQEIFMGCQQLKRVYLTKSLEVIGALAFMDCHYLEELHLPQNLQEIGYSAFSYCNNLTEIAIPASVNNIERQTFSECKGLIRAEFENQAGWHSHGDDLDVSDSAVNAENLKSVYAAYDWWREID